MVEHFVWTSLKEGIMGQWVHSALLSAEIIPIDLEMCVVCKRVKNLGLTLYPPKYDPLSNEPYGSIVLYSSSLSAAESSTLMTTDDGTMSSSSTSNNYGVVLLQV
ncbi:hypothetical protein GQR58_019956 [Nymphon striatum]|nr:hypothetical protein GQR58_019956 [Nymphon striatum]